MKDKKAFDEPLRSGQSGEIRESGGSCCNCGILESQFPFIGKCCNKNTSVSGSEYGVLCQYCSIWSSLPEGVNLKVTYIMDCFACGYGKRLTE